VAGNATAIVTKINPVRMQGARLALEPQLGGSRWSQSLTPTFGHPPPASPRYDNAIGPIIAAGLTKSYKPATLTPPPLDPTERPANA